MSNKAHKLQAAATRAKQLADELFNKNPTSPQWDYSLMEATIKETYKVLQAVWKGNGTNLSSVRHYLSEEAFLFLSGKSQARVNVSWFDLMECFDFVLEDIAIISVINLPGGNEDKFIVWLDHEKNTGQGNDLENDRADEVADFNWLDNFANLSGLSFSFNGKTLLQLVGTNDCWTFKWNVASQRWLLDFVIFDQFTDTYLDVVGKSISLDEPGFNFPRLM